MKTKLLFLIFTLMLAISVHSQVNEEGIDGSLQFANAVAVDGNWAVAGNMYQTGHLMGSNYDNAGMISIYKKQPNGSWLHHQDIDEPNFFAYENNPAQPIGMYYGCDVDISLNHIIVGAYAYDSDMQGDIGPDGMAFIYEYNGITELWEKVAELAPELAVENEFGWSVAIDGYTAVVGDPSERHPLDGGVDDRDNIGAAYVYTYSNGSWNNFTKLTAYNGWGAEHVISVGPGDNFGYDVDVDGNTVVIGAPNRGIENGAGQGHGSVYVFTYDNGIWSQEMLDDSDADNNSKFGYSVAVKNDIIVAGAPFSGDLANNAGEIVVYENQFGIWDVTNQFASDATEGDYFGCDVDVNANGIIAVGAYGFDSKGKVYFYDFNDNMSETDVQSSDIAVNDEYGYAVGLSSSDLAVGAWKTDRGGVVKDGTLYLYSMSNEVFAGNWTGAVSSDWSDPLNWSDNNVPNNITDVTIPQAVPNYPEIDVVTAVARNVTIEAGASLTIGTGYLNAMGDLTNHGQLINDDFLHLYFAGDVVFVGAGQQDVPAGTFEGDFQFDAGANSYLQGDVKIGGDLDMETSKRLYVGTYTLSLGGRMFGNRDRVVFSQTSSLVVYGEQVTDIFLPGNMFSVNNLTINIPGNEQVWLTSGTLTVYGQIHLLDGDLILGFQGGFNLTIYNPIEIEEGRLLPNPNGGDIGLVIMDNGKSDDELYVPATLDHLSTFWVSRTAPTYLLNNMLVDDLYGLYTAAFDVNGFEVIIGPDGDMWIGGDAEISEEMVGEDAVIDEIVIESGNPTFDFDAEVENNFNITPQAGEVNIAPGRCITVNGTTTIGANLILKADADGNACFIDNGPVTYSSKANANIIVETYIPSKDEWHYISSPVKDETAEPFAGCYLNAYDTDQQKWIPFTNLNQSLNSMQGYSMKMPGTLQGDKIEFSGELNTARISAMSIDLSNGGDSYNLVGNPFPSTIDWDNANWTKTNLANAIYIWNPGLGTYTSYVNGAGVNGGTQYIPAMQGFFVEATGANPSLQINNNNVRVTNEADFLKSDKEIQNQLKIQLLNGNETDEVMVRFLEGATPSFDADFDAWKLFGRNSLAQLFIKNAEEDQLAIQTLPSVKETEWIPLGLQIEEAGDYELFFDMQNSFSEFVSITLEDKKTQDFIYLQNQTSYTFQYDSEEDEDRFVIHFKDVTGVDELNEQEVNVYYSQNQIYIANESDHRFNEIRIYNLAGQLLMTENTHQQKLQSISANEFSRGSYIIQLQGDEKTIQRKIIINR
jgi:hypothetical protein